MQISVTAYKKPPVVNNDNNGTIGGGDEQQDDFYWGDPEEISDAEFANNIYDGNWTVNNELPPPVGAAEMNQSMLGARTFCARGFEPINFVSGNFYMKQLDSTYTAMPDVNSSILRTYNTQSDENNGPFGNGWSWYYSTKVEGEEGYEESYEYDDLNRIVKSVDSEGYEKYFKYDDMGRLTVESDNTGKSLTYTYTTIGQIRTITNAEGETTELFYNLNGNTTKVEYADGTTETYHYDETDQLIREYDRVGLETKYTYDAVGNVVEVKQPSNKVYKYEYDANGNMIKMIDPLGNETTYEYDKAGNAVSVTDAMGNTSHMEYNAASMIEKIIDASGTTTLTVEYSILGEVLTETDALNNATNYSYDELSRLTTVTDPLDRSTSYEYDGADNITKVIDGNGNITKYEYNTVGLLTKETDALGNEESYKYFVDGLLEQITQSDGTTNVYEYDRAGRMNNVNYSDGTSVNYGYNEIGTVTTMVDSTGTTVYQYDDMQRLISTTDSNDKTVLYEYDILGRRTSITLPDGQATNYEYDLLDRIKAVYDDDAVLAEYEYNEINQLISNVRNDITTTYEYNSRGFITELTTSDINSQIQKFSYQYDAVGNITDEVRIERGNTNTRTYEYDGANQLVEFTDNDYIEKYTYDSVGNMLTKDVNSVLTSYVYNDANQLITETIQEKTIEYIYNQNGELTSKSTGENYTYDVQGNLTGITGNGIDRQYTYNGAGNRLSETVDGETTFYVNDINRSFEEVLQTYASDGTVINTYTYGIERIHSTGKTNETYLYDGKSSVVGAVGSDNSVVTYAYTAYGDLMPSSPTPNVYGYNGEQTDFITGQQYLRARYYQVGIQRFIQEDDYRGAFTEPQTMNRYIYVGNNPINRIDPSGYGWLKNTLNKAKEAVTKVVEKTKEVVTQVVETVKETTKKVVNTVTTAVKNTYNNVKTWFNNKKEQVSNAVEQFEEKVENAVETAKEILPSNPQEAMQFLGNAASTVGNAIGTAAKKTYRGVVEVYEAVEEKYCSIVEDVKDGKLKEWAANAWEVATKPENLIKAGIVLAGVAVTIATAGAAGPLVAAGIGAAVGGVSAIANTAVDDYYEDDERKLDRSWKEYLSAGITGAVLGGASAGLSTSVMQCGMSLLQGTAIMSGTAAVTSAGTQLLETGSVDPTQVLVDTAMAGGTFFVGTGLAKAISGGGCFVAGTVVLTSLGLKNIKDIKNGDYVLAENPETGEQEYKMVVDTFIHEKTTIVELEVNGETIQTTVEHPFWVENKGWIRAEYLNAGDIVRLADGKNAIIEDLDIIHLNEPVLVYNFEVSDYHTYYVADIGVLVHNTCNAGGVADDAAGAVDDVAGAADEVAEEVLDVELKYKEGWTESQRLQADQKVAALSEADTVKTSVNRSGTSASQTYKSEFGVNSVADGFDVDHVIDLQLGGADVVGNMAPLDSSVNRSLGSQIYHKLKDVAEGTIIGKFTID